MNYYAAFGIAFLFLGGLYLDERFHTEFFWAFTGIILGIIYLIYETWKSLHKN